MEQNFEKQNNAEATPEWKERVIDYLAAVKDEQIPREDVGTELVRLCISLTGKEGLSDWGELQRFLRERDATVQLIAAKFKISKTFGLRCIDLTTGEPREYFLDVRVGYHNIQNWKHDTRISDELNEHALRQSTGMLTLR